MISAAIMAHPRRKVMAETLSVWLDVPIVWDPEPDATPNAWRTARLAWLAGLARASHHLVLQDDAIPCPRFLAGVEAALAARPDCAVSFYANQKPMQEALDRGSHWCKLPNFLNAQAVAFPVGWIEAFVAYADRLDPGMQDDSRMNAFLRSCGEQMNCTVPSLVQHACPSDSLLGYNNRTRVSRWFIGDGDPTKIDWTR